MYYIYMNPTCNYDQVEPRYKLHLSIVIHKYNQAYKTRENLRKWFRHVQGRQ